MGLFKPDLYRFFAFGFVAGAVFVFTSMDGSSGSQLAEGMMPVAEAAPTR